MSQKAREEKRCYFCQRKSFLEVIRPIVWVAKILGVSAIWIKSRNGRFSAENSSPCTVRYSYICMFFSLFYHSIAVYSVYLLYKDITNITYLVVRMFIATLINFSFLVRRKAICALLQRLQDLGIQLPRYYTLFPILIYGAIFYVSTSVQHVAKVGNAIVLLSILIDVGPPILTIYSCFLLCCQAKIIRQSVENQNADLLAFIKNPMKSKTSLRDTIKRHLLLRDICREGNDSFGLILLLISFAACWEITYCLFASFVSRIVVVVAICVSWSMLHLISTVVVMLACQQVENAVEASKAIAMQIQLIRTPLSPQVQEEARELHVQLKQLPLRFSARGLFYLNSEQLRTAISTILTYTVILIQNSAYILAPGIFTETKERSVNGTS